MPRINIAIDGFSSTGKSTVAKRLAQELGYLYVDTGAMYRAVALYALRNGLVNEEGQLDAAGLVGALGRIELKFIQRANKTGQFEIALNGESVEAHIRNLEVSSVVSPVAVIKEVRELLVQQQQQMGKQGGVVMDGRDIGTVVFPDAQLKIFMTASAEKRTHRRLEELLARGEEVNYEDVYTNIVERDRIDSTREIGPLRKAEDAIEYNNDNLSLEEQYQLIYQEALRLTEVGV
jgi:cytidylate kinase